jgi:hypothetical protein
MPLLVIERVNFLGRRGPSIWTFTNRHGQNIGDTPQEAVLLGNEDVESVVEYPTKTPGVPGVDPDFDVEPTGVEMDSKAQGYVPEEHNEVEPTVKCPVAQHKLPPNKSMAARNTRIRKLPEKYVPSMKGNKNTVVLTQIVASLKESKDAISTAQMFVKLMNKGVHQNADIVGMVMAQLSLCHRPWYWRERYPDYGTSR